MYLYYTYVLKNLPKGEDISVVRNTGYKALRF